LEAIAIVLTNNVDVNLKWSKEKTRLILKDGLAKMKKTYTPIEIIVKTQQHKKI